MTKTLLLILVFSGVVLTTSFECQAMNNEIDVTLEIQDEQGRAIPYATIWAYVLPRANPLAIDADDLLRVTTRYQSSFEFAVDNTNNQPIPYVRVYPMGDESGRFRHKIDYRFEEGSAARRPDKISFGFTVMKRGYLPARIDFAIANESSVSGKIVLKRDPKVAIESQPYLVAFERLRSELCAPY